VELHFRVEKMSMVVLMEDGSPSITVGFVLILIIHFRVVVNRWRSTYSSFIDLVLNLVVIRIIINLDSRSSQPRHMHQRVPLGVVTMPFSVRQGITAFFAWFIPTENLTSSIVVVVVVLGSCCCGCCCGR